jgi:hypothetical protein
MARKDKNAHNAKSTVRLLYGGLPVQHPLRSKRYDSVRQIRYHRFFYTVPVNQAKATDLF